MGKVVRVRSFPKNTGLFLKYIVPVIRLMEKYLSVPLGQSLIVIGRKEGL